MMKERRRGRTVPIGAAIVLVLAASGERVSFPETGDPDEAGRLKLARAIISAQRK